MQNFKPGRADCFNFYDAEDGDAIKISVYYSLGGPNMWHGNSDSRGVWVSITPVSLERSPFGLVSESMMLFGDRDQSGVRMLAVGQRRKNAKQLQRFVEALDTQAPEVCRRWREDSPAAAMALLRQYATEASKAAA